MSKPDGSLERVNPHILELSKDVQSWIAERRKNWPTRERTKRKLDTQPLYSLVKDHSVVKKPSKVCKFFLRGNCRAGDNCRFLHTSDYPRVYKRYETPLRESLFKKLVQRDYDHEDEPVLDFVIYLLDSGHLSK